MSTQHPPAASTPVLPRKALAEALGTFVLVLVAVGSAVFGIATVGKLGIAVTFGFVLLALAYSLGPVSGCHVNPAVTLALLIRKDLTAAEAAIYWSAQTIGAVLAAAVLKLLVSDFGGATDETHALGANDYGTTITLGGAFLVEVSLTFVLVLVVLLVHSHRWHRSRGCPALR